MPPNAISFRICDLRDAPHFAEAVADRVWRAWWQRHGVPKETLAARVAENFTSSGVPLGLVAEHEGRFLGTASLIASDMDQRPALTPWVAAVWVEPEQRHAGVGAALVEAAAQCAFRLGFTQVYLAATPANAPFYLKRGWSLLEADIDGLGIFVRKPEGWPT
ncbi:MAG TPA: GNAT family N-acetyltransferase [Xanthobacteraceae bacterium]|nr:GNAT family N-acetyltransferase [Xanthobacteraceae bacterium]